jgi:hypothetical protein
MGAVADTAANGSTVGQTSRTVARAQRAQATFAENLGDLRLELLRRVVCLDSAGGLRDICAENGSRKDGE